MSKLKLRKNLYIESLEWAKNKQENGFTHSQLREELALNDLEARWVLENLFGPVNGAPYFVRPQVTEEGVGQNLQYYLSAHAFSELNDFYELREARKNATSAFWLALASMFIAGIFGILQVQAQLSEAHTWFELICSIF